MPPVTLTQVRIDRWLTAARVYKSRAIAQRACAGGHVRVGGRTVEQSHAVRVGDRIEARAPRGDLVLIVTALAEKRQSPAVARTLYEDRSPPPPPKEEPLERRERGAGRPTKRDRRAIRRLKDR